MDALVIKLLILAATALIVTGVVIGLELHTHTGSRRGYALQGIIGALLLGILVSLLTVR